MLALMKEMIKDRLKDWSKSIGSVLVIILVYGGLTLVNEPISKNNVLGMLLGASIVFAFVVLISQMIQSNKLWFSAHYRLVPLKDWQVYLVNLVASCLIVWGVGLVLVLLNWLSYFVYHVKIGDILNIEGDIGLLVAKNSFWSFLFITCYLLVYASFVILVANWVVSYVPQKAQKIVNILLVLVSFYLLTKIIAGAAIIMENTLSRLVAPSSPIFSLVMGLLGSLAVFITISIYLLNNKVDVRNN